MKQKNALSVQSLACHGKCSLTEALPIVSSLKISLSVLPTAVLSAHTGGFGTPERLDTTEFLKNSIKHFKKEKITFNGIYTGYFANPEQIEVINENISSLKKDNAMVLVDPVLGDNGSLFKGITEDFVGEMLKLCQKACVITPNVTEAYLLCKESYCENPTDDAIIDLCIRLFNLTRAKVILTGISRENKMGAVVFDGEKVKFIYSKKYPAHFHGTGDIFASLLFGLILNDMPLTKAVKKACDFVSAAIKKTVRVGETERDGLNFEQLLKNI